MTRARERISIDSIVLALATPERPDLVAVSDAEPYAVVRASLVTPMPHFAEWATSEAAARSVTGAADVIARALNVDIGVGTKVTVRGRGVTAGWTGGFEVPVGARVALSAEGVVGARVSRGLAARVSSTQPRRSSSAAARIASTMNW